MNETSGFISFPDRSIYATAFIPDELPAHQAVVVVEPTGEEKRAAYRMMVRLARKLAGMGVAAIKFDLSGTGDSTAQHQDVSFDDWRQDTAAAAREILAMAKCDTLAIVAARAGALVAAAAAAGIAPQKIVFAEPVLSGKDYVNDLERRQNIKNMMSGAKTADTADQKWSRGEAVDFGGYPFGPALANGLKETELAQILPTLDKTAVHAIRVSASSKLPPAWGIFNGNTTAVADKPFWGQLDYYESDFVIDAIISALN